MSVTEQGYKAVQAVLGDGPAQLSAIVELLRTRWTNLARRIKMRRSYPVGY